ncbi:outer membrane protein OmpA [Labilithrix luteola]|uniref:Outer membrane protein OmpA n=1 Tax=Labilithrix luteola TaxID=1391654 RepID=A0A0K1QF69_9BACT|nr:outer membrane protein OmpA [Labilithrix luteola]
MVALMMSVWTSSANAQQMAQGFELERLYTSAPGASWFVMDSLDMHGGLGGAASMIVSYARNPLRVSDGTQHLTVVSDAAFLELGCAATYDRFRLYASFASPLTVQGNSGTVGGYTFTAPSVDPSSAPDAAFHARVGFDARIVGDHASSFRMGLGAQFWIPGGSPGSLRENYLSDGPPSDSLGAYNAMARVLFAGDIGLLTYAGHLGFHLRPLDDSPTPESPRGSEGLFGAAAGVKVSPWAGQRVRLVLGPEVFGTTALRSFLGAHTTGIEALATVRIEGTSDDAPQLRFRVGAGGGLDPHFGAPESRVVLGIELFEFSSN